MRIPYMHKVNGKSVRDYRRENIEYNSKPAQIKARSERTVLRRASNEAGTTHKGDGTNIDHIKPLSKGGANTKANSRVVSESTNKSFARNANGSMKSQTSKRESKKK